MSNTKPSTADPFPLISTGLDLEDLARWRDGNLQVLRPDSRIFSDAERVYCDEKADPIPHYAARWCAKEAVIKAMAPLCGLLVTQVEVVATEHGPEVIILTDYPQARVLSLSLTHSQTMAAASAILLYLDQVD